MQQKIPDSDENPIKLDAKDRQILGALFSNARMPFSLIARKVRLSKEVVNYRVKRLISSGLLVGFNTVLDVRKLGWEMFFAYIRFRNIDVKKESEILQFLGNHQNIAQLFKCIGSYDAVIKVFARHSADVDVMMKEFEAKFRDSVDHFEIDYIVEETAVPFSFLYDAKGDSMAAKSTANPFPASMADLRILSALANDARIGFSDIGTKLRLPRDVVKYHVKKLEKESVILKYRPDTLPKKLGYNWYFLILKTEKLDAQTDRLLTGFLTGHPNVTYVYRTIRSSDVQVELRAKTTEKLNEILMDIRGILKDFLKRAELLTIFHEHKYTYVPECITSPTAS